MKTNDKWLPKLLQGLGKKLTITNKSPKMVKVCGLEISTGVDHLRGWSISSTDGHWYAHRHGVRMNNRSYKGILTMILQRPY